MGFRSVELFELTERWWVLHSALGTKTYFYTFFCKGTYMDAMPKRDDTSAVPAKRGSILFPRAPSARTVRELSGGSDLCIAVGILKSGWLPCT